MEKNQQNTLTVILALTLGVVIGANWPKIKQKVQPLLKELEKNYGDLSFASLGALSSQKEKFEDLFAEWKDKKEKPEVKSKRSFTKKKNPKKTVKK